MKKLVDFYIYGKSQTSETSWFVQDVNRWDEICPGTLSPDVLWWKVWVAEGREGRWVTARGTGEPVRLARRAPRAPLGRDLGASTHAGCRGSPRRQTETVSTNGDVQSSRTNGEIPTSLLVPYWWGSSVADVEWTLTSLQHTGDPESGELPDLP